MTRRSVAIAVAISLLAAGKPAIAEETKNATSTETKANDAASTQRIFIYTSYGVAAVGLGLSFVFLAQANSAYNDRLDIARQNGSDGDTAWKCSGADQQPDERSSRRPIGRERSLGRDDGAHDRWRRGRHGLSDCSPARFTELEADGSPAVVASG